MRDRGTPERRSKTRPRGQSRHPPGRLEWLDTRNSVQSPCQAPSSCQTRKVSATCPRTLWFWSTKTAQRSSGNRANLPPVALTRPSVPLSGDAHKVRPETTEVVLPSCHSQREPDLEPSWLPQLPDERARRTVLQGEPVTGVLPPDGDEVTGLCVTDLPGDRRPPPLAGSSQRSARASRMAGRASGP